eukprot:TRINITY_DN9693_c0_g1_i1.p1 TRINITY_DN9693_c0_g1~~TRINITY_DN9693_c0_g1_i1.p1  ORF type:complete len:258 (+),score=26.71 TRINITY_DN9693_c0_g1_i1:315-1088(+)
MPFSKQTHAALQQSFRCYYLFFICSTVFTIIKEMALAPVILRVALKLIPMIVLFYMLYQVLKTFGKDALTSDIKFAKFIMYGFIPCAMGDVLLEAKFGVAGILAFLVGQCFYVYAFMFKVYDRFWQRWVVQVVVYSYGFVLVSFCWVYGEIHGAFFWAAVAYAFVICLMVATSFRVKTDNKYNFAFIGAAIFLISDSLIAIDLMGPPEIKGFKFRHTLVMTTYWIAQALISFAALNLLSLRNVHRIHVLKKAGSLEY